MINILKVVVVNYFKENSIRIGIRNDFQMQGCMLLLRKEEKKACCTGTDELSGEATVGKGELS